MNALKIAGLLLVAAFTRTEHWGGLGLPDFTWAAFLIGGLLVGKARCAGAMLAGVAILDVVTVQITGAVGCLTPAYAGYLAAMAVMWFAGSKATTWRLWLVYSIIGTTTAFLVSNVAFWAFSGYFESLPLPEYLTRVAHYLVGYQVTVLSYSLLALVALSFTNKRIPAV